MADMFSVNSSSYADDVISGLDPRQMFGGIDLGDLDPWTFVCRQRSTSSSATMSAGGNSGHATAADHFRFVVDVYVVGVICLVGFVGSNLYLSYFTSRWRVLKS